MTAGLDLFDYSPVTERDFDLPDGASVAVWLIPNLEHFRIDVPAAAINPQATANDPDVLNYGWRDYGLRVGFWRLLDIFDRHGVRGTVALNSEVCDYEPAVVEAAAERDWEFMGHGATNSQEMVDLDREEQHRVIRAVRDRIEAATGAAPTGWLGPALAESYDTPAVLAEAGFRYVCDWCNDDQPYPLSVPTGRLLAMPYTLETNDFGLFLNFGLTGSQYERTLIDQFDVLYEEGAEAGNAKVMAVALHPFLTGQPHRSKYLDRALDYIAGHGDVWLTTGGEIAAHYEAAYGSE